MNKKVVGAVLVSLSLMFGSVSQALADEIVSNNTKNNLKSEEKLIKEVDSKITKPKVIEEKYTKYEMNVEVSKNKRNYTVNQKVSYTNTEKVNLKEVYFHIYPNAFEDKEIAGNLGVMNEMYEVENKDLGEFDFENIIINGEKVKYEIIGETNTILKLNLKEELKSGKTLEIDMKYNVKMPHSRERFGTIDDSMKFGNWYPIVAVYDEKDGWNLDSYYYIGDPFYSDISDYKVKITAPKDMVLASTGNIKSKVIVNDKSIYELEASKVRDFAFVLDPNLKVIEDVVDGIKVKSYVPSINEKIDKWAHEIAVNSIKYFNKRFGKYPYDTYSVVATPFSTGMEYPGIVFISKEYYKEGASLRPTISHETGHQWWFGVVGNDQVDEPWLDEALTTYSEIVYLQENNESKQYIEYYKNSRIKDWYNEAKENIKIKPLLSTVKDFEYMMDYGRVIYGKGALFLDEIAKTYGEDKLDKIFKTYYERYKFKTATTEDFKAVCEEVLEKNLDELFNKWVYGEK